MLTVLGDERVEDGPDLRARRLAGGRKAGRRERTDDGEEHVESFQRVAGGSEIGLRRFRRRAGDGVEGFDVGHAEKLKSGGGLLERHDGDDVSNGGGDVEEILRSEGRDDGLEEGVELGKIRNEMMGAILAEELERLRRRRRDFVIGSFESRGDVGKLELDVFGVTFDPIRVSTNNENRGVADLGMRREFRENVHDLGHNVVVPRVHLRSHRSHRK